MTIISENSCTVWNGAAWMKEECKYDAFGSPVMGAGHYLSFTKTSGRKINLKNLKVIGIKSKEFKKVLTIADHKDFPLGYYETISQICKSIGFDALFSKEHGLMLLQFSLS